MINNWISIYFYYLCCKLKNPIKMTLDLTKGITETSQYKAWRFPGGEIHFKTKKDWIGEISITTRLNSSDDIIFLMLVVDTLRKDDNNCSISLNIPYMPYQQADRNFGSGECFSLKTITNLINSMYFDKVTIFDPHSDVTPALVNDCVVLDNSFFITEVLHNMSSNNIIKDDKIIILSPDAGAYKKIYKLCEKIGFKGQIECCSKSRDHNDEKPTVKVPIFDPSVPVLIIDDICVGGRTFNDISSKIENKCYLAVSHGIFDSGGYGDPLPALLENFETIFTTNSRKEKEDYNNERITVINII